MTRTFTLSLLLFVSVHTQLSAESLADRAKAMIHAEFVVQPSVFSGDKFPSGEFLQPGVARKLLGDYQVDVTYYDNNYQQVEKPTTAGRYGAVATITAEDGGTYTRYRTLYKSPQELSLYFGGLVGAVTFPKSTGIEASVWQSQQSSVNEYLTLAVQRDVQRSSQFAVLLAGLNEISPGQDPVDHLDSAFTKDRKWWLHLKRKLNGNAERFTEEIVVPPHVEGLGAPVLRVGTAKEAGMHPDAVLEIDAVLQEWSKNSDQPFNACVARRGVLFFDKAYGSRDGEPITTDTRHVVFSITKALSGALVMMFVEQGAVQLDDPVEKYLPEFADQNVENSATIHHLFTHTADMDDHFTDLQNDLELAYGEAYPFLRIGKQHRYNGTSIAIGLKVLEQITGLTLPELYHKYLFDPLGCESIASIDGSALTWSNAHDLARFGQMLANRGAYGNKRFMSEATFQQMLPAKLDKVLGSDTDITWGIGLTWFRGNGLSDQTIGHGSASSCTLRVDLEKDLVITMTRRTAGKNFGKYHPKFIQAVTSAVVDD